ncbi:MAG: efflux RND transporter periplasmic adaptor subunit [Candidatus Acidiferrales bacterium]
MKQACFFHAHAGPSIFPAIARALFLSALTLCLAGCGSSESDPAAEAPPPAQVENQQDSNVFQVDHPEQFPLFTAVGHNAASQLSATGAVSPDVARTVPVISLASGRVVDIRARLGDSVHKGQLLLRVRSDDVSGGYSDYRKAVADELLARKQITRSKDLFAHGAIPESELEIAQDAEDDAKVAVETTEEHLRLLGNDPDHPTGIVDIYAPISGVITDQQVTNAAGVQSLSATNPFTISDLSFVWIVCDVYENALPNVRLGETADIKLNAYPDKVLKGTISNIGAVLDPATRASKVRIEVANPGFIRPGMFATATFHGQKQEVHATIPSAAILHLRDRDWVFVPEGDNKFRRVEIVTGNTLPANMQEVASGITPGTKVILNALVFENSVDQ